MKSSAILTVLLIYFFVNASFQTVTAQEEADNIAVAIRTGNSKELSKHFNINIDLNIKGNEGVYSKAQAELILKDFFSKHIPKSFSIVHKGSSKDGARYAIGNLITGEGTFRTYFYMKKKSDKYYIHEFSLNIEGEDK